jgi:hypothetical protein
MDETGSGNNGGNNTAVGANAMGGDWAQTVEQGTAIGSGALSGALNAADYNVAVGYLAADTIVTGDKNTIIGTIADTTAGSANRTAIGYDCQAVADNSVTLGDGNVTAVYMADDSGAVVYCSGVNFPDSQAASADANTLDDYEEGTWTPGLTFNGNAASMTFTAYNEASYTKIGQRVTLNGTLYLTSNGSSTGNALLTGLPFTVKNDDHYYAAVNMAFLGDISFADIPQGYTDANQTTCTLYECLKDGTTSALTEGNFGDGAHMKFTISYVVA